MSIPFAVVITSASAAGERLRERMPTPRRLAQALGSVTHPVFPAQFPLREATEEDGAFSVLGHTYDMHVPVRLVFGKEVRALAGWHMPGLCTEDRPFGALDTGWPLDEQFLEPFEGAVSFDRVVYTTTAPTIAIKAWERLGKAAARSHVKAGANEDAADGAVAEHLTTVRHELNRANPTIKRVDQPVLLDLKRQILFVGANGAALDAALTALRDLLCVAALPEGVTEDDELSVHLTPIDMTLWLATKRHNDPTMSPQEWIAAFGRWIIERLREGPLYVSLLNPDQRFRVSMGNTMRCVVGEGKQKYKWQAQLPESRGDSLPDIMEATVERSTGMTGVALTDSQFSIEIAEADETTPAFVGIDSGKVTSVDVTVQALGFTDDEHVEGSKEAALFSADRLDLASMRGLKAAAVIDVYAVIEVLWTACYGELANTRQAVIPSASDPTLIWPIPDRSGVVYTEAELQDAGDKRASELRRVFGV